MGEEKPVRGFIFACTDRTESECYDRMMLAADRTYGPVVIRIREGDLLFLHNLDTDALHGVFRAVSKGDFNLNAKAWNGRYPYQIHFEYIGNNIVLKNAKGILAKISVTRNTPLIKEKLSSLLEIFMINPGITNSALSLYDKDTTLLILNEKEKVDKNKNDVDIEEEIPMLEATTMWDFPRQSYGITPKGNNRYPGVTPALIIYNMIWRYTDPGDLVVDPMCGSGTTIDVCKEEKRRAIGYDIHPVRPDVIQNDARNIPLDAENVDMVFIDSPYGDNVRYNEHPDNIGNISSESEQFYDELEKVMEESHRILKDGKVLGWLIGDQWVKRKFTPVGFEIYNRLCKYFEPMEIVCVNRRGQSSHTGLWFNRARRFNFYLRGFKYLIIVRKTSETFSKSSTRKIEWTHYDRG